MGFLQHAEEHVGDVEAGVLLLAGGGDIVEQGEQGRLTDTDFADAIHARLERCSGPGLQGGVRLTDERSGRPGVVRGHADENEVGRREDGAGVGIEPIEHGHLLVSVV